MFGSDFGIVSDAEAALELLIDVAEVPAALGVRAADPDRQIVALSGDYDFQFMIEELAVGAQHKLPDLHVVVNYSCLDPVLTLDDVSVSGLQATGDSAP